jgi:thiamine-phosphate diphosphorylase
VTPFPSLSPVGERRQARLGDARLAIVVGTRGSRAELETFLRTVCGASVDLVRLRDDTATEDELRAAADVFRRVCDAAGALFLVDRLPGLAVQVGADGVHLGAVDADPDHARRTAGPDALIGAGVRSAQEIVATGDDDVDLLVVGDEAAGRTDLELGRAAVRTASHPWFGVADGPEGAVQLVAQGARRILLGGGLAGSDPAGVCWEVRRILARHPIG